LGEKTFPEQGSGGTPVFLGDVKMGVKQESITAGEKRRKRGNRQTPGGLFGKGSSHFKNQQWSGTSVVEKEQLSLLNGTTGV